METPRYLAEAAIAVGAAVTGAILTYFFTLYLERRKQRIERQRAALEACRALHKTLADWKNEIADASSEEGSAEAVRRRLQKVYEHEKFQWRFFHHLHDLKEEPLCDTLRSKAYGFHNQAFESKGWIAMALGRADFFRDYAGHRRDALNALQGNYKDFEAELEKTIPRLQQRTQL